MKGDTLLARVCIYESGSLCDSYSLCVSSIEVLGATALVERTLYCKAIFTNLQ